MRATTDQSLTPALQLQLYLATGLVLLPHLGHLPLPVTLFLFAALGWRLTSLRLPRLQPGRWLLIPITFAGVYLVYSQHHTLLGRDAGVSLLSVMLVLKTLEVRKRRDLTVTVYIAYFVIVTQFLFNQSFFLLLYLLAMLNAHTSLLLSIQRVAPAADPFDAYRKTFRITLQALPIALILFVLFPRLTHPLWNFGYDASAVTGLSDRVSPGTITQLIQSSEIAFRASFKQKPPPPPQRYWRALVLWDTDGYSWFNQENPLRGETAPQLQPAGDPIEYTLFLEPHRQRWLYALDLPAIAHKGARLTEDFLLTADHPVERPLQYEALSFTQYHTLNLSAEERQRALALGQGVTDRQRQLVAGWRRGAEGPSDIVQRALDHFHRESFVYTLNPPAYLDNPVEQFLFQSREGFCEHYASAFTQLMRVAGIPARMVVGFQGGEYNRVGDYYAIRNYDAHAWSEVWIDRLGWVRVDPTAAVAPERVRQAIQTGRGAIGTPARFLGESSGFIGTALQQLGMTLDAAEMNWRRWVLGFSRDQQFSLMREFGLDFLFSTAWSLITLGLIFAVLALIAYRLVRQGRVRQSAVVMLYERFCRRMADVGLPRQPSEGPLDYSRRVAGLRPDLAPEVQAITRFYIGLRYGARQTRPQRSAFADRVKRFRPRRISRAR